MRRTSFFGALTVIAIGGVFAFALQSSPKWLDLHVAGLILMLAGIADLLIRFILRDDPLLSPEAADVAAAVEPLGEPVLDVFGNPIRTTAAPVRVLQPPAPGSIVPISEPTAPAPEWSDGTDAEPIGLSVPERVLAPEDTHEMEIIEPRQQQPAVHDQVVREPGDYGTPDALMPVSPLTGRPVRAARRRWRR